MPRLLAGVAPALLQPPVNVLRLSLHPDGVAPRIANLTEWRAHLLERLRRQIEITADGVLVDLLEELQGYPVPPGSGTRSRATDEYAGVAVPLHLVTDRGLLSFLSTTTIFGSPVDVTLSELALESFFPADSRTAELLQQNS